MFNFSKLLLDYKMPILENTKNTSEGWVNIKCPFCPDSSNHLGWCVEGQYFNCWHCGHHSIVKTIMVLLDVNYGDTKDILRKYTTGSDYNILKYKKKISNEVKKVIFPKEIGPLHKQHRKYLADRDFDSYYLEKKYDLKGTNHLGNYKFRIIAPIYYNGKIISFQGRDITNKQKLRYKACKNNFEVMPHKHVLYNIDNCLSNRVIVVEGITDVWRIGDNSICTFGIGYTIEQLNLIYNRFNHVFILYDSEEGAQDKATDLARDLDILNVKTEIITLGSGDPAQLSNEDVILLKNDLLN